MTGIQYPYALDATESKRHIEDASAAPPFSCGDCNGEMIARRGKRNRWHFSHKATICTPRADPDNFLHRLAQDKIIEGFLRAKESGSEYLLGVLCATISKMYAVGEDGSEYKGLPYECNEVVTTDIALPTASISRERSIVSNTRSDIVVEMGEGQLPIIIEVVNTHPIDAETKGHYQSAELPVYVRDLSWETIDELDTKVIATDSLNVSAVRCASCDEKRRQEEEELAKRKETLNRRIRVIDAALRKLVRRRCPKPMFRPWYEVHKPSWGKMRPILMYPNAQRPVFANAIILTELGFAQHNDSKPYLFSYQVRRSNPRIVLYADLGGSDVVPIYEDSAAMLYVPDLQTHPDIEQYTIDRFGRALQKEGVNVRTGFESSTSIEQVDVDPVERVSRTVLNALIRWHRAASSTQRESDVDDHAIHDLMTDYPGRPVKSPRKWVDRNE